MSSRLAFLLLSSCFTAWHQQLLVNVQRQSAVAAIERHRQLTLQRRFVHCWRSLVLEQKQRQQLMLRAAAHHTLRALWSTLQHWQSWVTDQQLMKLKHIRCDHAAALYLPSSFSLAPPDQPQHTVNIHRT